MVVEMADMTKKVPLGIVEYILAIFSNHTCQIDVFKREISLGIWEDRIKFDMDGGVSHTNIPVEKIYMESSILEEEYFNPLEIKNDVFSYESLALITEYLVNISKRRAYWNLNKDILKINILTTNMTYPSRKIRRIRACTNQRPQRKHVQYAVSSEDQYAVSSEDQYAVLEIYVSPQKTCAPPHDEGDPDVHRVITSILSEVRTASPSERPMTRDCYRMDDQNITMEEYIRLKEEKAQKHAIAFNDGVSSEKTFSCEPTISSLNDEIDFRISFDIFDDEDYTVISDKNSFSYKIISTNDLKTFSENDNEKVNMPSLPSPEPTVNCFDDLDFFNDFKNEFPAIDEEEQNILSFNDLFPFNIIHPNDFKSEKDNDNNEVDIIQSSRDMALPSRDQRHQREVHRVQVFDFRGLPDLMAKGLSVRMLMEHRDAQGGLESVSIRRIQCVGYDVLEFLGVGTTFDIFQNILFPYSLNTAYCLSWIRRIAFPGYGVLDLFPLWSLVSAGTDTPYLP
ncbi:hypothetical protein Tco_0252929 [Tanacetum coccineum]